MSKLFNRRDFLLSAAPLIAAPLILGKRNVTAASLEKLKLINSPQLTVLHDGIENPPNYGWASRGAYGAFVSTALGIGYAIPTIYSGTLSSSKLLKSIEIVAVCNDEKVLYDFGIFGSSAFPIYLGIWSENVGTFCASPLSGSLANMTLPVPNIGSQTVPYYTYTSGNYTIPAFLMGWNNLDILLPANTPIKMAIYFEVGGANRGTYIYASLIPGFVPNWAFDDGECGTIAEASMASRITVADVVTAADCEISGRVVNQTGRGIVRARLTLQNARTGETVSTLSNSFGYFHFGGLPAADFYLLSASAKGHTFIPDTQTFQLNESVSDVLFVGR